MQTNIETEQAIDNVIEMVKQIALWRDYDKYDLLNYERVDRMRGRTFELQQRLEVLAHQLTKNTNVMEDKGHD